MSTSSPETATETPQVDTEKLKDPAERGQILDKYTTDLGTKTPEQVDALVNEAVSSGLFKQNLSEEANMDDTFTGKLELSAVEVPDDPAAQAEVQKTLDALKAHKFDTIRKAAFEQISAAQVGQPDSALAGIIATQVEGFYQQGKIDLIPGKQQGRQQRGQQQQAAGATHAELTFHNRNQQAVKEAIDEALGWQGVDIPQYKRNLDDLGKKKDHYDKAATEQKAKVREIVQREKAAREEKARAALEVADREKTRVETYGKNEVILKAGTVVEGVTPATANNKVEQDPLTKEWKLKADTKSTDQEVVDAAHKEMERELLERKLVTQYGREKAAVKLHEIDEKSAEVARIASDRERIDKSYTPEQVVAIKTNETALVGQTPDQIQATRDQAQVEAYAANADIRGQMEVYQQYQDAIDRQPDDNVRRLMVEARDKAVADEQKRQTVLTKEHADRVVKLMGNVTDMQQRATRHEAHRETVRSEEEAREVRAMLNVASLPSVEIKSGGFRKGPKMLEAWFEVPGNPHLWVVERYNRRTGEMVSQSMVSSEENPDRSRSGLNRPPQSAVDTFAETRAEDRSHLAERPETKKDGSEGLKDKVRGNFRMSDEVDNRYRDYLTANPEPGRTTTSSLDRHRSRKTIGRSGGFMYWLNRVGKGTAPGQQKPKGPAAPR